MAAPRVRDFPRTVLLLALTSLLADTSTEMLYPVLPLFLTQELRAPASAIGLIEGIAQATQYLAQGISGPLADRIGHSKGLTLAGYSLSALAKPTFAAAVGWPSVLASRFADRVGSGVRSAPRDVMIAGSVDEDHRGAAFGLEGIGDNLGAVLGPLITAGLLGAALVPIRDIFLLATVPAVLAVAAVAVVHEPRRQEPEGREVALLFRQLPVGYWRYLVAAAVMALGNLSVAFVILKAMSLGVSESHTVLIYAAFNLAAAAISYPVGVWSDAVGRKIVLLAGQAIPIVVFAGLAFTGSIVVSLVLFVLAGAGQGLFRAVGKSFATDLAPESMRASAIGLYSATVGIGMLAANLLGGLLWQAVSPHAAFTVAAALSLAGLGTLAVLAPSGDAKRTR